jgi:hypothetical protein
MMQKRIPRLRATRGLEGGNGREMGAQLTGGGVSQVVLFVLRIEAEDSLGLIEMALNSLARCLAVEGAQRRHVAADGGTLVGRQPRDHAGE